MSDVPVARRTYFPLPTPPAAERRPCPVCGRDALSPWYLHRDRERRVWRRWVCLDCHAFRDLAEEDSA
jgi:hypothetical protein